MVRSSIEEFTNIEKKWMRRLIEVYEVGDEICVHDMIQSLKDAGFVRVPTPQQVRFLLIVSKFFVATGKRTIYRELGSRYKAQFYKMVKNPGVIK